MKIKKLTNSSYTKLILFFSGWGTDPAIVASIEAAPEYTVIVCYDYTDLCFPLDLSGYTTIHLFAWSMGVWAAEQVLNGINFASAIAINGTACPVHDTRGIPVAVFEGTLANLSEEVRLRFNRRMCGSLPKESYQHLFVARTLADVKAELYSIGRMCREIPPENPIKWTKAILSRQDRIFPFENLLNYWQQRCPVVCLDAPHYSFYLWDKWKQLIE